MAPEASIDLIEVAGGTTSDYATALQTAQSLGASVVVMSSFVGPDPWRASSTFSGCRQSDFQVAGMTVVDASGDNGENSYAPGAYPSVVDVASSDLTINSNNSWNAETAWSDTPSGPANEDIGGSAGGYSIFPTPSLPTRAGDLRRQPNPVEQWRADHARRFDRGRKQWARLYQCRRILQHFRG